MILKNIAKEIKETINNKQKELDLVFEEETHKYTMKGRSDYPSVSKVLKCFYTEFPTEEAAFNKSGGDPEKQQQLIDEWAAAGTFATNLGSRVHYLLEKKSLDIFDIVKEVREPIFDCDLIQQIKGDSMVVAGTKFLELMKERGAVLIDTEMILGHPELEYTGTPDKLWLIQNKDKTEVGIIISDYKTNKPKNFEPTKYTKKMKSPFTDIDDTSLGHYYIQLPLYLKLFKKMLEGSKYENIPIYGGIIVLLKENSNFEEFRIPKTLINKVLDLDISKYLKK